MANLALALKEEIRRLARKEIKAQMGTTKSMVSQYRREIAALKKQARAQAKKLNELENRERRRKSEPEREPNEIEGVRFSSRSVKAQRNRLGFSAKDYAKLIGVSPLTIYNWEHGKSRPRQSQLASLAAVRGIGKRDAMSRLGLENGEV